MQAKIKKLMEAVFSMVRGPEFETKNECAGEGQ
jgi:purine nucleoside phosphorylase